MLSLAVSYLTAALLCLAGVRFFPLPGGWVAGLRQLNWTSFALAVSIAGLETGFLAAYRAGWNISQAGVISNVTVSLILLPLGLLIFKERITPANIAGVLLAVIGLYLLNQK